MPEHLTVLERAIERAKGFPPQDSPRRNHPRNPLSEALASHLVTLSPRELEVAALISEGLTNSQIAASLFLSTETVKSHVRHSLVKTQTANRAHMVATLIRNGDI